MEADDLALIEQISPGNPELRHLVAQHHRYEQALGDLEAIRVPSEADRREISELKYKKLHGKNRIQQILTAHREAGSSVGR